VPTPDDQHPEPDRSGLAAARRARVWDDRALQAALDSADRDVWGPVAVVPATGSTQLDAADQVREGAPEGFTVVSDEQSGGRGRLDRAWVSPPGAGLAMSLVLRPRVPVETWGWLPLIAGLAVASALRERGLEVGLKWPNDVVVDGPSRDGGPGPRKVAGVLVERVCEAAVVGIGVNVDLGVDELPVSHATSTRLEGVDVGREDLLVGILEALRQRYSAWQRADGDALASGASGEYVVRCLTVGRRVRAVLPGGTDLHAAAVGVGADGSLEVRCDDGSRRTISAGDIEHLR
jgi:BirA family biotin operon repressor/biotin-[acetyl-CoA-carboxylase] ligase